MMNSSATYLGRGSRGRAIITVTLVAMLTLVAFNGSASAQVSASALSVKVKGIFDPHSSFYQSGILASDINADGKKELLIGNQNGNLYCLKPSGGLLWSYNTRSPIESTPSANDVDGDGRQEIWVGDMNGKIWGFDASGKVLSKWGWPKDTHKVGGLSGIFSSPAIGDINGDGSPEVVVGNYGQRVYAWNYRGQMLPGWPYNNEDTIWSSPALADLDYDGVKEVIIGADSTGGVNFPYPPGGLLYAFDEDASIMPGFPAVTPEVTWSSPAVADIDGDGRYEIVVGTGVYYTSTGRVRAESQRVYAYNHDGTLVHGWPVPTAGSTFSSPAIGDIDGDGQKEIVVGTMAVNGFGSDHVEAFKPNGNMILDIKSPGGVTLGSPVLGDISGDGLPDIVIGNGHEIDAWDYMGTHLWSRDLGNFVVGEPAVGDFDLDGRVEIVVATGDAPGGAIKGGKLYVFDCGAKASGADSALFPWPMFRRTSDHRATMLTGREPPPPPPASSKKWYLAEGSTAGGMETWVLIMNPGDDSTKVRLTYMTSDGAVAGPVINMPGHSRRTFNAAATVPDKWDVSTMISSDRDVVAERAMYGNNRAWAHDSIGVTAAEKTWYIAEGSTAGGMETWVLVQNPNRTAVTIKLSYMTSQGPRDGPQALLPAYSRRTFNIAATVPNVWSVSTKVVGDKPVIAERAMYGNNRTWAQESIGAHLPATTWNLAEGSTAGGMETWILVQNPTYPETHVHVDYISSSTFVPGPSLTIPSSSRATVNVSNTVNGAWSVSAVVTSDNPVIVERAMYGNNRTWADDSIGVVVPRKTWYLPEGSTAGGMETWVLVQNPGATQASVAFTYMTDRGLKEGPNIILPPKSRRTIFVADTVPDTWQVSTMVTSNRGIVVERAMYGNNRTWAHESIGFGK